MEQEHKTQAAAPAADVRRATHNFLIKTIAAVLFAMLVTASVACFAGAAAAYIDQEAGAKSAADSRLIHRLIGRNYNSATGSAYANLYRASNGMVTADALSEALGLPENGTNYRYVITDRDGSVLAGNIAGQTVIPAGEPWKMQYEMLQTPTGELVVMRNLQKWYATEDVDADMEITLSAGATEPEAELVQITPSPANAVTPKPAQQGTAAVTPVPESAAIVQDGVHAGEQAVDEAIAPDPESESGEPVELTIFVQGYYQNPPVANDDIAGVVRIAEFLHAQRDALLTWGIVMAVLAALAFVFLLCAAGRHRDSELPRRNWIDRIPFDVLLALSIGALALDAVTISALASITVDRLELFKPMLICWVVLGLVNALWLIMMCMTFAARIKTRTFWRNNISVMVVCFFWRLIMRICRWIKGVFTNLPMLWRGIVSFAAVGLVLLITFVGGTNGNGFLGLLCFASVVTLFVLMIAALRQANRLKEGGAALARGDLSGKIETKGMFRDFRAHGENLNSIAAGMNRAVNERMKSERMKTDLITNVSHDLKTPLTSIVNFVDLLKKEDLHNETAAGYVEVLDRQAARLKKLTEDLVEASKASSGALRVHLAPTDVTEILEQSLAEYGDKLRQAGLVSVLTRKRGTMDVSGGSVRVTAEARIEQAGPLLVQADGRLLWRVFDNLLNNIVKYAMPGTRVYIDVIVSEAPQHAVAVAFKNISREPLNIPASELTERFVRGDASRSAEGSGLGLSIAKSLAELQKAVFQIDVSGDLFTAMVTLEGSDAVSAPEGFVQTAFVQQDACEEWAAEAPIGQAAIESAQQAEEPAALQEAETPEAGAARQAGAEAEETSELDADACIKGDQNSQE